MLLTVQHGNFDIMVALCALAAVAMLIRFQLDRNPVDWLVACAAIGAGVLTKTVPFVLVPLLAIGWRNLPMNARMLGAALVIGPATLGISIIYVLGPSQVMEHVIRYRSLGGCFGLPGLMLMAGHEGWIQVYGSFFCVLSVVGLIMLSRFLARFDRIAPYTLTLMAGMLLMAVPSLGPGFGSQYVFWFLPLLAVAVGRAGLVRRAIIGWMIVAAITYLIQYAFTRSLGCSFVRESPGNPATHELSQEWSSPHGETIVRLPLFAACLVLLLVGTMAIRRDLLSTTATA
jgi:hypothetical protein